MSLICEFIITQGIQVINSLCSTDAVAFTYAHFGTGTGPIYLNNVDCSGSEDSLTECSRSSFVSCSSGHREDAGVRCQGKFAL